MCFSAINGSGPAYLSELLHIYTPSRTLRSSSDTRMLEIQQYKRKTHGFRTFSCFGPHIWNSLPKLSMKKHIIKICQTAYFELKRISPIRRTFVAFYFEEDLFFYFFIFIFLVQRTRHIKRFESVKALYKCFYYYFDVNQRRHTHI